MYAVWLPLLIARLIVLQSCEPGVYAAQLLECTVLCVRPGKMLHLCQFLCRSGNFNGFSHIAILHDELRVIKPFPALLRGFDYFGRVVSVPRSSRVRSVHKLQR